MGKSIFYDFLTHTTYERRWMDVSASEVCNPSSLASARLSEHAASSCRRLGPLLPDTIDERTTIK